MALLHLAVMSCPPVILQSYIIYVFVWGIFRISTVVHPLTIRLGCRHWPRVGDVAGRARGGKEEGDCIVGDSKSGSAGKDGTLTTRSHACEMYRSGNTWAETRLIYSEWSSGSTLDLMYLYLTSSEKNPRRKRQTNYYNK
jgi:hypothetical protein